MAKDEGKDEYQFNLPDFDEDAFIHREMVSFKTTAILFVWGIVAAAVTWGAFSALGGQTNLGWLVGLALCAAFGYALKWLFPKFGADISHFKRREWTGTGFLFFFTWLAFVIVAVNPPLSDFASPQVLLSSDPPAQMPHGNVSIAFLAADNDRVASQTLEVTHDGTPVPTVVTGMVGSDLQYHNLTDLAPGTYVVKATATDAHGRLSTPRYANFTVADQDFTVTLPHDGVLDATTKLVAKVGTAFCDAAHYNKQPCVRAVYLHGTSPGLGDIAFDPPSDAQGPWTIDASFKGWTQGGNDFTVRAEFLNHFEGAHPVDGGLLERGPFHLNVTSAVGTHEAQLPSKVLARLQGAPHVELVAVIAVVLGAAAWSRKR